MINNSIYHDLKSAKDWIMSNQNDKGAILWDQKGKWDYWDHCECLIALAIYQEWDAFDKGIHWGSLGKYVRQDIADFPKNIKAFLQPDNNKVNEIKSNLKKEKV